MIDTARFSKSLLVRRIMIDLAIMTVIGIVLALIGPFGSFAAPLPVRIATWLGFAYIGYAIYRPMGAVVESAHGALDLSRFGLWIAACLVATVPMACVVWFTDHLPGPVPWPSLEQALTTYSYVLVIGGGVTALFNALDRQNSRYTSPPDVAVSARASATNAGKSPMEMPAPPQQTRPPFFDRLPPSLGTDLVALEMEDHYVRAHTALGSDLILMRMRDALAELGDLEGAQVHRSWWVARIAVEDMRRDGRNIRLHLTGGLEAPVSRNMAPKLKDSGWW